MIKTPQRGPIFATSSYPSVANEAARAQENVSPPPWFHFTRARRRRLLSLSLSSANLERIVDFAGGVSIAATEHADAKLRIFLFIFWGDLGID